MNLHTLWSDSQVTAARGTSTAETGLGEEHITHVETPPAYGRYRAASGRTTILKCLEDHP